MTHIEPLVLLLTTSEPLRRAAESTDDVIELKLILFSLADCFDQMRATIPTLRCVSLVQCDSEHRLDPLPRAPDLPAPAADEAYREQSG